VGGAKTRRMRCKLEKQRINASGGEYGGELFRVSEMGSSTNVRGERRREVWGVHAGLRGRET